MFYLGTLTKITFLNIFYPIYWVDEIVANMYLLLDLRVATDMC